MKPGELNGSTSLTILSLSKECKAQNLRSFEFSKLVLCLDIITQR